MAVTEVGFGLITCQRHPGERRSDAELYAHALRLASEVEALGFDSVWTSEHHFFDDSYVSSQLPLLAAIAARTRRIALGPCVLLAPLFDPVHLAEDAATVDLIANGRLVLGLGLGWREEEFEGFGIPRRERARRMRATVSLLRQAWGDGPVTGDGDVFSVPSAHVTPKPASHGGPPIWLGAMVEPAIRRAARIADGFVATKTSPEMFATQVGWALDELERAGKNPARFTFAVHHPVFVWDGEDAWERVEASLDYTDWKYSDMAESHSRPGPSPLPPPIDAERRATLKVTSLWGSPAKVAEGIAAYGRAAGVDVHFIARSYFPGMDPAIQDRTIRLLAQEVTPMVRGRHAVAECHES
jgi:alkanesulfonate monooxygenase SsuD/methylene tetrahydromethanopterin reductase-like flavin-dependent oxidoreductase (luciferase family)